MRKTLVSKLDRRRKFLLHQKLRRVLLGVALMGAGVSFLEAYDQVYFLAAMESVCTVLALLSVLRDR